MDRLAIRARLARLTILASFAAAAPLAAQGSDTTGALPFRRGQWGTQFGFDGTFASAGALKFRSNRTAWVIDAFGYARHFTYEPASPPADAGERDASDYALALQLGARRYRPVAARVNAFAGAGLVGQLRMERTPVLDGLVLLSDKLTAAGLYGEFGASWMVNRNLALSAAANLAATYDRVQHEESPSPFGPAVETDLHGYGVSFERARLMVTVFF
jgi:hypothetical protein